MESAALASAAELTPKPVAREVNAAVHYQPIIEMQKAEKESQNDQELELVRAGLLVCACDSEQRRQYFERIAPMYEEFFEAAECNQMRLDDDYAPVDLMDGLEVTSDLIVLPDN